MNGIALVVTTLRASRVVTAFALGGLLCNASASSAQSQHRTGPAPTKVRAIAGCWHITHGAYAHESRLGPESPTRLVRLDTLALPRGLPGQLVALRLAPAEADSLRSPDARWRRAASWRIVRADSIEIVMWTISMEAEVFYGRVVSNELRGVVRLTSDARPWDPVTHGIDWNAWPWARAVGTRVPCP